jgi:membrane-bound lytic murein transglycosylase D
LAKDSELAKLPIDSIEAEIGDIPESLDSNVDSLLRSWHVQYFTKRDEYCHDDFNNVYFSDSVYAERLQRLPRVINLPYNPVVRDCIELYAGRKRDLVRYMLGMADYFFPIIEPILDKHGLPLELKYLAVVESALNPVALSRAGACGLWQFMLPTGKIYGLEINSLVDERRDPIKSTEAACKYFEDMYEIYGDWKLVLASYNCGPGNVNKAIKRAGGKTNFWQIYSYLPKETRTYVPLFIAANYIMNYYCEHNICPMQSSLPLSTDTVVVNNILHFQQVADMCDIDLEEIRALNPQYKRDIVPGNYKPSVLKLPASVTYAFAGIEDTVFRHKSDEYLADYYPSITGPSGAKSNTEKLIHTVKKGETLQGIANKYGVTAGDIKKWNGMKSSTVRIGQKLRLSVDNGGMRMVAKPATQSKQGQLSTDSVSSKQSGSSTYKVKSGDSLFSIAQKYPGVSAEDLKKENGLTSTSIKPGQILRIPKS